MNFYYIDWNVNFMNRNREIRRTYLQSTKQNEEWRKDERKRRQGKKKES